LPIQTPRRLGLPEESQREALWEPRGFSIACRRRFNTRLLRITANMSRDLRSADRGWPSRLRWRGKPQEIVII